MIQPAPTGISLHFRLYKASAPIPLGWVLSTAARGVIDNQLDTVPPATTPPTRSPATYNASLAATALAALRCYHTGTDCQNSPEGTAHPTEAR
jgi:hypothetical protein